MFATSTLNAMRGTARASIAARQRLVTIAPRNLRLASTNGTSNTAGSTSTSTTKLPLVLGLLVAGGGGGYYAVSTFTGASSSAGALKQVPVAVSVAPEDEIPVLSPVKALDFETANAKLRQEAESYNFAGLDGAQGRADIVRVASNVIVEDEYSIAMARGVGGGSNTLYAGVYDGHAGWATSKVLQQTLIPYVSNALSALPSSATGEAVDTAIKKAFTSLDDRISSNAIKAIEAGHEPGAPEVISAIAPAIAGSCALLAIYDPRTSTLRTAVTGDSRGVLGNWSPIRKEALAADPLSKDQTGLNKDEAERLHKAHPGEGKDMLNEETGRIFGLAVVRAFGDVRWKWPLDAIKHAYSSYHGYGPRPKYKTPPYLTAEPEVTTRVIKTNDFVILASDGLWDVFSNEDAVECVNQWVAAKQAGKAKPVQETKSAYTVDEDGNPSYKATPEHFAIEDLDNAAVCLAKNALGGSRRAMFRGSMTAYAPVSRYVRDDITVQVIFFNDPTRSGN